MPVAPSLAVPTPPTRQRDQWCTLCWQWGRHDTPSHLVTQMLLNGERLPSRKQVHRD